MFGAECGVLFGKEIENAIVGAMFDTIFNSEVISANFGTEIIVLFSVRHCTILD